jgi:molecular chaperone DnaJ
MAASPHDLPDYYAVLGVVHGATREEIEAAFRRLARQCHPDLCPDAPDAAERFKAAAAAYEVLGDPERRRQYDRGRAAARPRRVVLRRSPAAQPWKTPLEPSYRPLAAGGLLGELRAMFDETLGGASPGVSALGAEWPPAHLDLAAELVLSPAEARYGTVRRLAYPVDELCPVCCGQGATDDWVCADCGGGGIVRRGPRAIDVRVPAGVRTGTVLTIPGAGRTSLASGRRGALHLHVVVAGRRPRYGP